jgi:Ig-like domain from next to BRCA1 gene/Transglutaminase-like superfamily
MRRINGPHVLKILILAGLHVLAVPATADAQSPPPCPSSPTVQEFQGQGGPNSTSDPYPIDLKPCETVVVQLQGSASNHPSGNANMQMIIRNSDGASLATTNFLCGQSCTTTVPLAGTVPGYPMPGTRGDGGLAKDVIVKVGVFNWFGTPPATYKLIVTKTPRPGYNTMGNSFANAPHVTLPKSYLGSVHPLDPGQFVKVTLAAQDALYASGHVKGHASYGAYWEIEVYDSAGTELTNLVYGTAYGGPHLYNSRNPFVNTAAVTRDFYVRFWCRFWPVHDFSMNLVRRSTTTEITEVGFRADHLVTRWDGGQPIDPNNTEPTWIRGRGENDDYPVAYTKEAIPLVFGVVSINPALPSNTTVGIRVKKGGTVLGTRLGLIWSGSTGRIDSLVLDAEPLEQQAGVKESRYTFDWELTRDGGATWLQIGQSGEHRVFWTYSTPIFTPFTNMLRQAGPLFEPTYDLALEKATEYAAGASDPIPIKVNLTWNMAEELEYTPGDAVGGHPLAVIDSGHGQCDDMAHLMRGLLRSIGIDIQVFYLWGGTNAQTYWYSFEGYPASFRVNRDQEDAVEPFPHFTFHAITGHSAQGELYDPSYGDPATGPFVGLDETLDAPDGNFVLDPLLVHQAFSNTFDLTGFDPPFLPCPHNFPTVFAGFVFQIVNTTMASGQPSQVSLTFRNTGVNPWLTGQGFTLGFGNAQIAAAWGALDVALPNDVMPDEEVTFTFNVNAPAVPGTYLLSFRLKENGTAFGAATAQVSVTVQ